jgi:hypothetical protein
MPLWSYHCAMRLPYENYWTKGWLVYEDNLRVEGGVVCDGRVWGRGSQFVLSAHTQLRRPALLLYQWDIYRRLMLVYKCSLHHQNCSGCSNCPIKGIARKAKRYIQWGRRIWYPGKYVSWGWVCAFIPFPGEKSLFLSAKSASSLILGVPLKFTSYFACYVWFILWLCQFIRWIVRDLEGNDLGLIELPSGEFSFSPEECSVEYN